MSRLLVTGGAGRLGRSVVAVAASAGHDVVSIDLDHRPGLPAEQRVVDLGDAAATAEAFVEVRPDAVVHLAAVAVPFSRPEAEIYATNTAIMWHVLEAAVACAARSFLLASSPTVIGYGNPAGWAPRYLPLDEDHPVEPWHGYAVSKQAMEQLVAMAVRRHGASTRFGVFRPCYVIAPEEWEGAPTQQGHTVRARLDDPDLSAPALFNYLDARDGGEFVLAWLAAPDAAPNGTCFFVGAADALATTPLSMLLPRYVPGAGALAAGLTGNSPAFAITRAERLLGWTPKRSWRSELDGASPGGG